MCVFQKGIGEFDDDSETNNRKGVITMEDLDFGTNIYNLKELMECHQSGNAKQKLERDFSGINGLAQKLCTHLQNGIVESKDEIDKRIQTFGKNEIKAKKSKSLTVLALEALQDTTLIMLIICAIISIGLSFYHPEEEVLDEEFRIPKENSKDSHNLEWVEGVAIMVAVVVVVFVTAFNDWRKERQFRCLQNQIEKDHMASVIRSGVLKQICVKDILVGDICLIRYGDLIPADGIVTQACDLRIDEASMTGETDLIRKDQFENLIILSGTHVMEGSGQYLVTAVGLNSMTGIIMSLLGATNESDEKQDIQVASEDVNNGNESNINNKKKKKVKKVKKNRSVLQLKLGKLALQIGYIGMLAALFTFIILCFRMAVEEFLIKKKDWSNVYIKFIISYLIQAITVIVVAVPEGLPLAVALALSFAVQKMTKDNNLVRHLDACETMGNATTICSDKTGTLTKNRMTVVECWISNIFYDKIPKNSTKFSNHLKNLIYESISVNSNYASIIESPKITGEIPRQIGNKTECGLLGFVNDLGGDFQKTRLKYPYEKLTKVYTFNSERKMMGTVIEIPNGYRLYCKGASEIVLSKCKYYIDATDKPVKLDETKKRYLVKNVIDKMALNGLRTICVAYRDFYSDLFVQNGNIEENFKVYHETPNWSDEIMIMNDMTCLCIAGIEDPVRDEVPDAIKKCQTSGVVVRMVTGDNVNTATSIAIKCGIVNPGDNFIILESKEFNRQIRDENNQVSQELLDKVWPNLRVLARSSPEDKYNLINGIVESRVHSTREVVAVTGDGTNDGPALKRADVGFAMGIQGTDVAKEASDIILTDDNFSSIVKAVMWGRNVYDAIAKFLQFQLTANFAAGLFCIVCASTIQAVPLKAVQMLWVNLVMDTLASLALATEPPTEDLLRRKPYGRTKPIISITMLKNIFFHTIYQVSVLFGLVWGIEEWMLVDSVIKYNDINKLRDPSLHFSIIFNAFVIMTLFNELNGRKIHDERNVFSGIQKNMYFITIWLFCFIGQILIVNFGGVIFSVVSLDLDHWMWCLVFGIGSLLWGQIVISIPTILFKRFLSVFVCLSKRKYKKGGESELNCEKEKYIEEEPDIVVDEENDELFETNKKNNEEIENEEGFLEKSSEMFWLRGANRIVSQLKVVNAFKQKLDEANNVIYEEDVKI